MALEIEPASTAFQNGDKVRIEEKEDSGLPTNHKIGKLNGVESTVNGHENGHSDALVTDSPRDKRSKNRSAKSTPTKSKKKTAKVVDSNAATDDENKSENSSSIFSKDTEDDIAVTDDYDASAEYVDISLALTPDSDDDEEIDVGQEQKQEEVKVQEEMQPFHEATILTSLRDRIRFSLSPRSQETKLEEKETPVLPENSYKGISGRRPLRSPTTSVFKQTEALADDASLKRKADQDSYSFQAKKLRKDPAGWSFSPLKWFTKRDAAADYCPTSHRKLHDEIEVMVVEEVVEQQVVEQVEQQVVEQQAAGEPKAVAESADKHQPEKIVTDEMTKVEAIDESVASPKSGKTWSCSVM
ncbi:hypothetical protein LSTR_LSTR010333 [Laodelphax striatellus]|uniref:Uncharacterized protein n=1 Tax=Laodelphax striatellus TaxID=195883 RepID=A0A482X0C2_LAOST|nr:hypothetical protein LSTR_LSTR010333 [Laodelphax striatellus]